MTKPPSINPPSVQIIGSSGQSVAVSIGTTGAATTGTTSYPNFPSSWMALWTGILFLGYFFLRTRKRLPILTTPIIVLAVASWVGCGGGGSSSSHSGSGTPAGTYTATVTAASGNLTHNVTLTVTVQ